jgi:hypothetical protein
VTIARVNAGITTWPLLADGALEISSDDHCAPQVMAWLPQVRARDAAGNELTSSRESAPARARIDVRQHMETLPREGRTPAGSVIAELNGVSAYHDGASRVELLASGVSAYIDLAARCATVRVVDAAAPVALVGGPLYSVLTLASAYLVGRLGGVLLHAGCVVDPDGGAWLLVGDSHAGKTTTCLSLALAGWRLVADDHVILRRDERGVQVEGWPRNAHLDSGYGSGAIHGLRKRVDLDTLGSIVWCSSAPLVGVLVTSIAAAEPTRVARVRGARGLAALLRQSAWLMADPPVAGAALDLLNSAVSGRCHELVLGRDSYARGDVIAAALSTLQVTADAA